MSQVPMLSFNMKCISGVLLACTILILSACGGGGGSNNVISTATSTVILLSSSSSSLSSSSSISSSLSSSLSSSQGFSSSSIQNTVNISGTLTYDYVPHNENHVGLNYAATTQRPIRGAVVELLDEVGQVRVSTKSNPDGFFSADIQKNTSVKVRVKAQLLNTSLPTWNFKVTDNTSNNALYVLDGALASSGSDDSVRNLNANSGWSGTSYSAPRSAAPFAILDDIYIGVIRVMAAGNTQNLNPLELRWSTKNSAADGDYTRGEIGTSFYDGAAIYILGDANDDTDEYDPHVLLHEWGHYLENTLSRSDSLGGDHSDSEFLDIRVAMSEGFANAFSGMMNEDASYADASGTAQLSGFTFNIARKNRPNKGYFNEGSIGSIFYNFYSSNINKIANDFTPIFKTLNNASYYSNEALTSIYLFHAQLKNLFPEYAAVLEDLMQEQIIFGLDEYGNDESNNGGLAIELPVYKKMDSNNSSMNVCSSNQYGEPNKLGNSQFIKLNILQSGLYSIRVILPGSNDDASQFSFIIYNKGNYLNYPSSSLSDKEIVNLTAGSYVLEVGDANHIDNKNAGIKSTTCFDVRVVAR